MNPAPEQLDWRMVQHTHPVIGENPIYEPRNDSLYWVSLFEPALKRIGLSDGVARSWSLPSEYVGAYALFDDGSGALIAAATGLYDLQFDSGRTELVHDTPYDQQRSWFNDGRCDPSGRFWVGTFPQVLAGATPGQEHYYRVDERGVTAQIDGMTIANGTAFSPDGRRMYIADRVNHRILAYEYDPVTGTPSNGQVFVTVAVADVPDGAAVDARGGYWITMYGGGQVRRYTPEGRLDRVIRTPVSRPTMCAFGGKRLDQLFVTTSRLFMDEDQQAAEPDAGAVFVVDVGETGIPEPHFPRAWADSAR
ncbi:SMP-30/gluconolactonase/LRE family protein [Herbiconiux ginsengi]|uniref:Sugar lactone lactonase YvrE n=1 Tax=Herbiconiux ginsengi TaxID=381665 RepID=A0A1H3TF06_9MICO|nr:SMP-30/gluconolactonase/LRE family protein [Herbiconiux ginsengi]SDZ48816.1 Sugar lactone lactonase YvrE [Herbiconiux ginsengi]